MRRRDFRGIAAAPLFYYIAIILRGEFLGYFLGMQYGSAGAECLKGYADFVRDILNEGMLLTSE